MNTYAIAGAAHEVNRIYCQTLDDWSLPHWEDVPDWKQQVIMRGVDFFRDNPDCDPGDLHENWRKDMRAEGYGFGPEKDSHKKTHPCMVPWDELLPEQRRKDVLFAAVCRALLEG